MIHEHKIFLHNFEKYTKELSTKNYFNNYVQYLAAFKNVMPDKSVIFTSMNTIPDWKGTDFEENNYIII